MALRSLSDLEKQPALRFPQGNEIGFWMDFAYWRGIPSDRDFYIVGDAPYQHDSYYLAGRGFGVRGDYGNGGMMVKKADILTAFVPAVASHSSTKCPVSEIVEDRQS